TCECAGLTGDAARDGWRVPMRSAILRAALAFIAAIGMMFAAASASLAQCITNLCPPPAPPPQASIGSANGAGASAFAMFDLNAKYLQTLAGQGGPGWFAGLFGTGPNPGGGGAPAAPDAPKYRVWTEAYGLASRTGAQPNFPGDSRTS